MKFFKIHYNNFKYINLLNIQIYIIIDKILVYFNLVGIYDTLMKILGDVLR